MNRSIGNDKESKNKKILREFFFSSLQYQSVKVSKKMRLSSLTGS